MAIGDGFELRTRGAKRVEDANGADVLEVAVDLFGTACVWSSKRRFLAMNNIRKPKVSMVVDIGVAKWCFGSVDTPTICSCHRRD